MDTIAESDWKLLRKMQKQKLALACENILARVERTVRQRKGKEHESYLSVYKTVEEGDREIVNMFDDMSRSNALLKLSYWRAHGLLDDADLSKFTIETQKRISSLAALQR